MTPEMITYWERGVERTPETTGAQHVMDAHDIVELAEALQFNLPMHHVLDVGCGTGRIAVHCKGYIGYDISKDAVAYCRKHGLKAHRITGPQDVNAFGDWVVCLSVFTHVDSDTRDKYLAQFHATGAKELLVDVLPGDGSGNIMAWTTELHEFESQLAWNGWDLSATTSRQEPGGSHMYFYARRAK